MIEWFDDVRVGMRFKSPEKLVTREDIKRFAAEFDRQPYHLTRPRASSRRSSDWPLPDGTRRRCPCDWRSRHNRSAHTRCWGLVWTSCGGWHPSDRVT
jgi:hypothetical protein